MPYVEEILQKIDSAPNTVTQEEIEQVEYATKKILDLMEHANLGPRAVPELETGDQDQDVIDLTPQEVEAIIILCHLQVTGHVIANRLGISHYQAKRLMYTLYSKLRS